jgi:hypothetical protein
MYNEKVILEKLAGTMVLVERRKRYVTLWGLQEKKRRHELFILMCCGLETKCLTYRRPCPKKQQKYWQHRRKSRVGNGQLFKFSSKKNLVHKFFRPKRIMIFLMNQHFPQKIPSFWGGLQIDLNHILARSDKVLSVSYPRVKSTYLMQNLNNFNLPN